MQMLLNKGDIRRKQFSPVETIATFTTRHPDDTPPRYWLRYAAAGPQPLDQPAGGGFKGAFGHTGFTGTCAWADPEKIWSMSSLQPYLPSMNNYKLNKMKTRRRILNTVYTRTMENFPVYGVSGWGGMDGNGCRVFRCPKPLTL